MPWQTTLLRLVHTAAGNPLYPSWLAVPPRLVQIEYFVAVAEEGHVGRAAQKLHVAPAVSRQIRRLEDELRAPLFVRTPRGMRLSEAGSIFLRHARWILVGVEAARNAVEQTTVTVLGDPLARRF